jgi:nicotinamide-nucleotide adenylyltransferase
MSTKKTKLKKSKTTLIIGRFQPFHLGHLYIIKKYSQNENSFIKIVIGSSQKSNEKSNPFTKEEREEMIKKTLEDSNIKNYKIYNVPDYKNDKDWLFAIKKIVGKFDIVVTGNDWVKSLFVKEKYELHAYNEQKERFGKIKATSIRKKWLELKSRKGIPKAVFEYLKTIKTTERLKEIHDPKKKVHYILNSSNLSISSAESCTGGAISNSLISYSGASKFFKLGIVAYCNEQKINVLKIKKSTLKKYTAVSSQTAKEMAQNIKKIGKTDYGISSTGYADPSDNESGKIFIAIAGLKETYIKEINIKKSERHKIIEKATNIAIDFLYEILKKEKLS